MKESQADRKFREFTQYVSSTLSPHTPTNLKVASLEAFPLTVRQCMYILDWSLSKCIFQKGVEEFLGYCEEEFKFEFILNNYHPAEKDRIQRIVKAAVEYCLHHDVSGNNFTLILAYRVKNKQGNYIKVLRQSAMYDLSPSGTMISNFSLLTDISFMDHTDRLYWTIHAKDLDQNIFRKAVYTAYVGFYTNREQQVLQLMALGKTNVEISKELFISRHTVATHRKNIYRKSGCSTLADLLDFAHNCGFLI